MSKPRKLAPEQLAPFTWEFPPDYRGLWGERPHDTTPARIDWAMLFGNHNPVELEVGFGKGLFLVNAGERERDVNWFGIEIIRKYQLFAANRVAAHGLNNVRTCCGDAKLLFRDFVLPGSVRQVHVFFPDPWWKTRHKKRTLMTPAFVSLIHTVLAKEGKLHFVTDVADYFTMVQDLVSANGGFALLPPPMEEAPTHDMDYLTNFERKFRKEGRPIHRALYKKLEASGPTGPNG